MSDAPGAPLRLEAAARRHEGRLGTQGAQTLQRSAQALRRYRPLKLPGCRLGLTGVRYRHGRAWLRLELRQRQRQMTVLRWRKLLSVRTRPRLCCGGATELRPAIGAHLARRQHDDAFSRRREKLLEGAGGFTVQLRGLRRAAAGGEGADRHADCAPRVHQQVSGDRSPRRVAGCLLRRPALRASHVR